MAPATADIDAPAQHRSFRQFIAAHIRYQLQLFQAASPSSVIKLVQALLDKQCSSDALPTHVAAEG